MDSVLSKIHLELPISKKQGLFHLCSCNDCAYKLPGIAWVLHALLAAIYKFMAVALPILMVNRGWTEHFETLTLCNDKVNALSFRGIMLHKIYINVLELVEMKSQHWKEENWSRGIWMCTDLRDTGTKVACQLGCHLMLFRAVETNEQKPWVEVVYLYDTQAFYLKICWKLWLERLGGATHAYKF